LIVILFVADPKLLLATPLFPIDAMLIVPAVIVVRPV